MSVAKGEKVRLVDRTKKIYRGVAQEMKKVHWPSRKELTSYTLVVLSSVVVVGLAIWVIDSGVSFLMEMLIK